MKYTAKVELLLIYAKDLNRLRQNQVAKALGVCRSTLVAGLAAEGTSYAYLLDKERKSRCEALLSLHQAAETEDIARVTGFTNWRYATRMLPVWFGKGLVQIRHNGL